MEYQGPLNFVRDIQAQQWRQLQAAVAQRLLEQIAEIFERIEKLDRKLEDAAAARPVKKAYTTAEAAELLGKSPSTVRRWMREGKLETTKDSDTQQERHLIPYESLAEDL